METGSNTLKFRRICICVVFLLCTGAPSQGTDEVYDDAPTMYLDDMQNATIEYGEEIPRNSCVSEPAVGIVVHCDNNFDCKDCSDEIRCYEGLPMSRIFKCKNESECVWLGNKCPREGCHRFCDGYVECQEHGSDEPYSGFGFKCPINPSDPSLEQTNKNWCVIPPDLIERWSKVENISAYDEYSICADGADVCYTDNSGFIDIEKCFQCLDGTVISVVQICDGVFDCADLSDECLCEEEKMLNDNRGELLGFCQLQMSDKNWIVNKMVRCGHTGPREYITPEQVCDGTQTCKNGADERFCRQIILAPDRRPCSSGFGVKAVACDGRPECPDLEDECNADYCPTLPGFCDFRTVFGGEIVNCTLRDYKNAARKHGFAKLCDGVVDCENGMDEQHCRTRKLCNDSRPTDGSYDVSQECDLKIHCKNMADERNCTDRGTHYYCQDGTFVNSSRVRDKIFDCSKGEDECLKSNGHSLSEGQEMIRYPILLVAMWLMAIAALIGNAVVIVNSVRELRATYRRGATAAVTGRVGACNKTLVLNLAIADFLMGFYLLVLVIKAVEFKGKYCLNEANWRYGSLCSGMGAIAVLSSQASVLIMVMMTTYRLHSVRRPFKADKLKVRYLVTVVIAGWIPPALLAFYPLFGYNNLFALSLKGKLPYFTDYVIEKLEFERFVQKSWEASSISNGAPLLRTDWKSLMETFCALYPKVCSTTGTEDTVAKWYGYYSADSVCLPRLFPHIGDGGWGYTVGIICFDFAAFLYIMFAYMLMCKFTVTGSYETRSRNGTMSFRGSSFSSVDELRSREDRVIWQRISRLLFTDFICWIPICITCLVSLSGQYIHPVAYQFCASILLPINSAVNPLLYSNAIHKAAERLCPRWVRCNRENYTCLCDRFKENETRTPTNGSRLNGATAASASDDLKLSGDQLGMTSMTDTRSITMSESERSRPGGGAETKQLISAQKAGLSLDENGVGRCGVSPAKKANSIARSVAKMFFTDRRRDEVQLQEPVEVICHRPKSQSTTSTLTTFTTMAHDE